jgi:hypothetical protein
MRIKIDPADDPPHALNRSEVKELLALVPVEWTRFLQTIHLKATLPEHSRFERPVIYSAYSNRLNVCCRGLSKAEARKEILRELARRGLRLPNHKLSAADPKRIEEAIAPLLALLTEEAS